MTRKANTVTVAGMNALYPLLCAPSGVGRAYNP